MASDEKKALPPGKASGKESGREKGGGTGPSESARAMESAREHPVLELLLIAGVLLGAIGLGFTIASFFTGAPMPRTLTIAVGLEGSTSDRLANQYAEILKDYGVSLEKETTTSSLEALARLEQPRSKVSVALLWSGTVRTSQKLNAVSLASVHLEPLWVFHKGERSATHFRDLTGFRFAIGAEGTEANAIAREILADHGLLYNTPGMQGAPSGTTELLPIEPNEGFTALRANQADALIALLPPEAPLIVALMREPGIQLMSLSQQEAFERRYRYLARVTVPRGTIDLAADLPRQDAPMVAPVMSLVARPDLHPALVTLLLRTVTLMHRQGDLLINPGTFPSGQHLEFPLHETAEAYFREGPSFLYRNFSFESAVWIERNKAMFIPIFILVLPLAYLAPWLFRWRLRRRISRWYKVLKLVDGLLLKETDAKVLSHEVDVLDRVEKELNGMWIPLANMHDYWELRIHLSWLQKRLLEKTGGERER